MILAVVPVLMVRQDFQAPGLLFYSSIIKKSQRLGVVLTS
jgi:hypothetical protein